MTNPTGDRQHMLSQTSDYATSHGCPEPCLRRIAEAGFTHVHWCHQWDTDFLYGDSEIEQIAAWLRDLGLQVLDLHGSAGKEKGWGSAREYERLAGVELVANRLEMVARLGGDVAILHLPAEPEGEPQRTVYWEQMQKSLDALEPCARRLGVRIALENLTSNNFDAIERVLATYGPDCIGLCYDSGHGNIMGNGLDRLDALKDSLIAVHLHDNAGADDEHGLLFSGTVDWPRLARIIAQSAYRKPISMESAIRSCPGDDEAAFLAKAFETGTAFAHMVRLETGGGDISCSRDNAGGA